MKNLNLVLLVFGFALAGQSFAAEERKDQAVNAWDTDLYFGYAFPMKLNYQSFISVTSDVNIADSGNATLIGLAVNYNCCSWFTLGVSGELYTPFNYSFWANVNGGGGVCVPLTLNHQAFLFNAYFHLPERLAWQLCSVNLTPLIGGGVGVGLNKVTGIQLTSADPNLLYTAIVLPNFKASVAWQATAGLNFQPEGSDISFGVTYRFKDEGKFNGSTQAQVNDRTHLGQIIINDNGYGIIKLRTNEVGMFLNFEF